MLEGQTGHGGTLVGHENDFFTIIYLFRHFQSASVASVASAASVFWK